MAFLIDNLICFINVQIQYTAKDIHLSDGLVDLLVMRIHLGEGPDLCQVNILSVAKSHDFIKGKDEWECLIYNF